MSEQPNQPLFVRFLEGQEVLEVKSDVKAGAPPVYTTCKWPSDGDDGGPLI